MSDPLQDLMPSHRPTNLSEEVKTRETRAKLLAWLENHRGRPQYRPAPRAAQSVGKIMRPLAKNFKGSPSINSLIPHWPKIVGERWARLSQPVKISGKTGARTLHIKAPGAANALIMASSDQIIKRVNVYLGVNSIHHIRVRQSQMQNPAYQATRTSAKVNSIPTRGLSPSEETRLQSGLASIKQPELKHALEALGRNVLKQETSHTQDYDK